MDQNGGNQNFQYHTQGASEPAELPAPAVPEPTDTPIIQWNASEFIDHQKSVTWFLPLILVSFVLCGVVYLLTRDVLATVVVLLACVAFGTFAQKKPRTLTYTLLTNSFKIGQRSYSYDDFRTFSIIQEGPLFSIYMQPMKRFMPPLTIYFDPQDGEKIFDALASHIPHEDREQDPIDRFMRKIRF